MVDLGLLKWCVMMRWRILVCSFFSCDTTGFQKRTNFLLNFLVFAHFELYIVSFYNIIIFFTHAKDA